MEAQDEYAHIVKGKRTKRLRPHSPLPFPIPTNSSTAEGGDSSGGDDSNLMHIITNSNSASSPANSFDLFQQDSSEEDEDLANCLILLAQGQSREESKVEDGGGSVAAAATATAKAGFYAYECKTCNRTFPSFQALGGHRASHKKPKAFMEEKKIFGFLEEEESQLKPLTLQLSSRAFNSSSSKSRIHECSICGAEFTSGQALGGHMRRHRAPIPIPSTNTTLSLNPLPGCLEPEQAKRPRTLLSLDLDLNLPAPEDDHNHPREPKFSFTPKQQQQQQQQQQQHQKPQQQQQQQQQQMQMQQLLLQRHVQQQQQQQQQRRDGTQILNGSGNGLVSNDALMRQNPATANTLATKMYEERLKLPLQRDPLDDAAMKQRFGDNMGQLLEPNHASLLKSAAVSGQPGQTLHGAPGGISGNLQQVQSRNQQLQVSSDIKSEMNPMMNPRAAGPEGSLIGVHGSNQGGNNLTLKGWPLTGLDQLRSGILQQHKSLIQPSQPFHQLQLQQQLLLQAQQNLASPSASDLECRKLRMLLNSRNSLGKDGQLNTVGDVVANVGSPMQVGCPVLPRGDTDMLIKLQQQQLQNSNQQQQQYLQHPLSSQQSQSSNHHLLHQQDKMIGSGSIGLDGSMSNTFRGNDQTSKGQIGRKRKQPVSSSGPANSSGTGNTAGPSPSSAPSTPSTHTPGDVISMPTLSHNGGSSKSLLMYGSDGMGTHTSAPNQLADVDRFVDDGSLDDNVESFLAHDDGDPRDTVGRSVDGSKGFSFSEVRCITASTSKVECCHFSSDGKLLATGGQDKKAVLWCTESFTAKSRLEEHSQMITDIRFSPSMPRLATSSADKTVRVWDVDNPVYSLRTFTGHSTNVTSLDFHPNKDDLICSCDGNGEIRYWSIPNGSCTRVFKGGTNHMRFQPRHGRYLAAAAEGVVSILDVETQACRQKLQGHKNHVSVCWDSSGSYLATVSEDLVKVWTVGSGGKAAECIHELHYSGNKFNSCAFHPTYTSLLVIGCYQSLELWNMTENKTMTLPAHDKLISSLAVSNVTGLVASASHDNCVKLWK